MALAVVVLALLGGGGYYAMRGPDPETVKARQAAEVFGGFGEHLRAQVDLARERQRADVIGL